MIYFYRTGGRIRRAVTFFFILFCINNSLFGFSFNYNADSIDSSLKVNADAIIREYSTVLEIEGVSYAKKKVHFVVTILNKAGEHFGIFNETYHKFLKVEDFSGNVYDSEGRLIKELKKNDFKDLSAISGYTLFDDTRRKYLSPVTNFFPYTIEYNYEIHYDGLFYYPTWYPITSFSLACENSSMKVILPEDMSFRYHEQNMQDSVSIIKADEQLHYEWKISNIQALVNEDFSLPLAQIVPKVRLAPNNFEIDGYYGNQQTWQNFGLWVKSLNQEKEGFNNETINEIKSEIGEISDTLPLIQDVYRYVQSRTRYVNLKLGIGGYQPIDAQTVHKVGYGDCKALTNYTKSILDIYGIKSHYTLVQAGNDASSIEVEFPSAQFNHAFLSVPYKTDTIWLECTSQTNPFGYIGEFTDNRQVLLITTNGGKIVKTPSYNNENLLKRSANINLEQNGNASAEITFTYKGVEFSNVSELFDLSSPEQKKWIYNKLPFSSFTVNNLTINKTADETVKATLYCDLELEKYASISNKRIFIPLLNFKDDDIPLQNPSSERHNDIYIRDSRKIIDSLVFSYPTGYSIEYLPESSQTQIEIGNISTEIINVDKNRILFYSSTQLNSGLYDKKYFNQLVEFTETVNKNKNSKAVLVKNEKPE